jgi:hypothetical protein
MCPQGHRGLRNLDAWFAVLHERRDMTIIRNPDGSLIVHVIPERHHESDDDVATPSDGVDVEAAPTTRVLHPGEGGYNEALAEWDTEQNPDRAPAVSTASGREEAMKVVLKSVNDPEASGEALRHVLVGGVHSVEAFSNEVADAEGGEPIASHKMTKIIGEVLAELDK